MKVCSKCNDKKFIDNFSKASNAPDGLFYWCKQCVSKHHRARSKIDKDVPIEKFCNKCSTVKSCKEFSRSLYSKDGLCTQCKLCSKLDYQNKKNTEILVDFQVCKKCTVEKPADLFFKDTRSTTGLRRECKACHGSKTEEYKIKRSLYDKQRRSTEKHKQNRRDKENRKFKEDIHFKLKKSLRDRINKAIKNNQKSGSAVRDLGCSIKELKQYLESRFYSNPKTGERMFWSNYTYTGWHIDHVKPLSLFDLTDREQFLEACHYTNLQPLWSEENFKKGNKYETN